MGKALYNLLQNEYQKNVKNRTQNLKNRYSQQTFNIYQQRITQKRSNLLSQNADKSMHALNTFIKAHNSFVKSIENNLNDYNKFLPEEIYAIPF